jgi:hypothetical protein
MLQSINLEGVPRDNSEARALRKEAEREPTLA